MIPALLIGRGGSTGFPGKNTKLTVGRPLMSYPILAAQNSRLVDKVYLSTDCDEIAAVGKKYGAELIKRPDYLATKEALSQDAFKHGYETIASLIKPEKIEMIILLFANGATITPGIIDKGIEALRADPKLDSAVTVSRYNMWSPLRAHKIINGKLVPFLEPSFFESATCDRDSQGDIYFPDCSAFVVRPKCFDYDYGKPPFPWIGRVVYPLEQWGGLDIDFKWQYPMVEFWLRDHGFTEKETPYEKIKV
ncbi:MAG: cytidylyltransferase [Candidatus Omnitrophica bacterium]|nr:cytidylyltransferase [Candidatus Omnitrophota bacterium]